MKYYKIVKKLFTIYNSKVYIMKKIDVVGAILIKDKKILCAQRG